MEDSSLEPIAIVGLGCRLPGGADTPEKLWDIVSEGRQCWIDVPSDRYNWKAFHHSDPDAHGTHNARGGFFLQQDVAEFDANFFGISAAEANAIDPQQRILLEVTYEALENAGVPVESIRGSQTGVYVALVSRDYDRQIYKDPSHIPKHHLTGCGDATACGRISYVFDLKGPSMSLDTGCSGSMVGLHLACQALRLGETTMAIVAGTNLLLGPDMTIAMSALHMINENGRCYPFDSRGAGYGRAEGVAVIVIKRLSDALNDGDEIRAIIRNSGVNQDGKTNGILLPSSESQMELTNSLYHCAGIDPASVAYVEAHGTGTQAGDAAEMSSIRKVFTTEADRDFPLFLGSLKANLGHSESTSGLASIIKSVLMLEKGMIPPVTALETLKDVVSANLTSGKIVVPRELHTWPHDGVRRILVNSFGFGGTNAHVILESAPPARQLSNGWHNTSTPDFAVTNGLTNGHHSHGFSELNGHAATYTNGFSSSQNGHGLQNGDVVELAKPSDGSIPRLFVLSAKAKSSLEASVTSLSSRLSSQVTSDSMRERLAHTLASRRSMFTWRTSIVAATQEELIASLTKVRLTKSPSNANLVFLFTGQGAQYHGMGRELLGRSLAFAKSLATSRKLLSQLGATWDLLEELRRDEAGSRINTSELSQPSTTAIQIAIVDLLSEAGIKPSAVLGHSSGEVAAAYAAGILTHESAIKISYYKGFVAAWCKEAVNNKGAMLAVGLGEAELSLYLKQIQHGTATVACVNSPSSVTVSGDAEAVAELKELLDRDSIFNRQLKVDIAYHSYHMEVVAQRFHTSISDVPTKRPQPPVSFFSSVTGCERLTELGPSYWVDNLVSKVHFSDALEQMVEMFRISGSSPLCFVEVGPHPALQSPVRQTMTSMRPEYSKWSHVASLVRNKNSDIAALEMLGSLFEQGVRTRSAVANSGPLKAPERARLLTDLKPYPWDHSNRYWHESRLSTEYRFRKFPPHDLLGLRLTGSTTLEPVFRHILSVDNLPWLQEHIIDGFALYPGSAFLCMAIEGLRQICQDRGEVRAIRKFNFKDVVFSKALVVPDSPGSVETLISLSPSHHSNQRLNLFWEEFRVTSLAPDGSWNEHCHGLVRPEFDSRSDGLAIAEGQELLAATKAKDFEQDCVEDVATGRLYDELRQNGIDYGDLFSIIKNLKLGPCKALGTVEIPDMRACMPSNHIEPHVIHPAVFDAFMHVVLPLYHRHCSTGPVMLTSIGEVSISADILKEPGARLTVVCHLTETGRRHGSVDVTIFQEGGDGQLVEVGSLSNEGFQGIGESITAAGSEGAGSAPCYGIEWTSTEKPQDEQAEVMIQQVNILSATKTESTKVLAESLVERLERISSNTIRCVFSSPSSTSETPSLNIVIEDVTGLDSAYGRTREETLKSLLPPGQQTLWIALGIRDPSDERLLALNDLAQLARRDEPGHRIVTFGCDELGVAADAVVDGIASIVTRSFTEFHSGNGIDLQYLWRNGSLLVPRMVVDASSTDWLAASSGESFVEEVATFHQNDLSLKLGFKTPGRLDSAVFVAAPEADIDLDQDEIRVRVHAHGVNQKDVAIATGRANADSAYVGEFAGTVTTVGTLAQAKFKPGDRVCGWSSSPFTNLARVRSHLAQKVDETMSFVEAASIPVAFQTAYHALLNVARIQEGQRILVHGAAGAVGQAAIALARWYGANIFATVSDPEKADLLVKTAAVVSDQIFSNRSTSFKDKILTATQGNGVDVILNCSSGELVQESLSCVADLGILIDVTNTKQDVSWNRAGKNITFVSLDMIHLATQRPSQIEKAFADVMALYREGKLRQIQPLTILPIPRISEAFKLIQSQKYSGKVVLEAEEGTCVRQLARKPDATELDPLGTYIVVGGSFDLSDMLCTYLASRGAKRVAVIVAGGNSEPVYELPRRLLEEYRTEVELLQVDFCDAETILGAISACAKTLPCIKGVISVNSNDQVDVIGASKSFTEPARDCPLDFLLNVASHEHPLEALNTPSSSIVRRIINHFFSAGLVNKAHCTNLYIPRPEELAKDGLNALLDYCTSASANKDRQSEIFAGLQSHHLSSAAETGLRKNPMLQALFENESSTSLILANGTKTGLEQSLTVCDNPLQARELVAAALIEQLASFVAIDADDIRSSEPVAAVGLDSLLAIEFKNWIVRTLQSPMQTSEILDAPSISELARLIVQRSRLINNTPALVDESSHAHLHQNVTMNGGSPELKSVPTLSGYAEKPPPLPIPELSALLERNLSYLRAFASDEEFQNSQKLAEDFQAPGSIGRRLYDRLHALRKADPEDWYANLYYRSQYLSRKGALAPWMNFFFTHPFSLIQHSQAERAAIVASVLISYKNELEAGRVRPRYLNEQQLCMDLYRNLFNNSREPAVGLDIMHSYPGNDYFVVFRRGHVFRVDFDQHGHNAIQRYEHLFTAILKEDLTETDWIGVLTADNRVSWAKNRRSFMDLSEENEDYIRVIDQSAFAVCLDDGAPRTPEQRGRDFHFGNGSNRWHDKSINFIISSNGMSGILGDHTGLDAGTVSDINEAISEACQIYRPDEQDRVQTQETPRRISRTTSEDIETEIHRMRTDYQAKIDGLEYSFPKPLEFGSALMKSHKIPPNSAFQLVVQLAARYHFGYSPACWEAVLQSTFHKGRVEINQVVSPQVLAFVDAAVDDAVSLATCKQLFIEAARTHSSSVLSCTRAGGSDRFLTMLREMAKDGEEEPQLFQDPVYKRTRPRKIMSNCHKAGMLEDGCILKDPEGIWLHPEIDPESVKFSMQGYNGNTAKFCVALTKAADKVQRMLTVQGT